jgi:hypothetical protein
VGEAVHQRWEVGNLGVGREVNKVVEKGLRSWLRCPEDNT